jgi:hypothetical protein
MKTTSNLLTRLGLLTLLLSLFASTVQAQSTVKASDIMDAMKQGKEIKYENVTIEGVLDFTYMDEKLDDLPTRRRWWRRGGNNTVNEVIESKITFVNVTFQDDVIAYFHDDRSEYTFTADFESDVVFKNCNFKRDAMFKYSEFEQDASFEGSEFNDDTTFKYAHFEEKVSFASTKFDEDAIFKYTKFRRGVSFQDARFERSLDMKYTKVRGDFDTDGLYVRWDINTKYTDINGRGFSKHMLNN